MERRTREELEGLVEYWEEKSEKLEKRHWRWITIAIVFIFTTLMFGSWYFQLKGSIPTFEARARMDGWYEGYSYAEANYKEYPTSEINRARYEGVAKGYQECADTFVRELRLCYCEIATLLDLVYSLSDGDYEFGYYFADIEFGGERMFYNFVKTSYQQAMFFVGDVQISTEEYCGAGIYVISPREFMRGYAAYGVYLRDERLPEERDFWSEVLSEEATAYREETWQKMIERYMSVEDDEWGEPCYEAQDAWVTKFVYEFYEERGDYWCEFMDWIKLKHPEVYGKLTPEFIEHEEEFWAEVCQ